MKIDMRCPVCLASTMDGQYVDVTLRIRVDVQQIGGATLLVSGCEVAGEPQPSEPVEPFIDVSELARRLSVRVTWVHDQVQTRRLPAYRVGRQLRFKWEEVLAALKPAVEPRPELQPVKEHDWDDFPMP